MRCRHCGKPVASGGDLCDGCQAEETKKAERIKARLDAQAFTDNHIADRREKEHKRPGCLAVACIFFPPLWLILLICHFWSSLSPLSSGTWKASASTPTDASSDTNTAFPDEAERPKPDFGFFGGDGNYYRAGGLFCDWAGNYLEWGSPFYDAKGNYCTWGSPFYDAKGNYCTWGSPFYDCKGNYIVPK